MRHLVVASGLHVLLHVGLVRLVELHRGIRVHDLSVVADQLLKSRRHIAPADHEALGDLAHLLQLLLGVFLMGPGFFLGDRSNSNTLLPPTLGIIQ